MYNHSFATPNYEFLHSIEYNREDGVLILTRDANINGFNIGLGHFNVTMYGAIIIFIHENPRLNYPVTKDIDVLRICDELGLNLENIKAHVGQGLISSLGLIVYAYIEFLAKLGENYSNKHSRLSVLFHS